MKGWQFRWFVLDDSAGLFSYYTSREKMRRGVRRGCVRLRGAVIGIDDEDEATFTVTVDGKTFHFQAQDAEERERWIRALEDTVLRHNPARRRLSRATVARGRIQVSSTQHLEDFDRKLAEADAYLDMMLRQTAALQKRASEATEGEASDKLEAVAQRALEVTESIKHAIVLLQIAKNAAVPQPHVQTVHIQASDIMADGSPFNLGIEMGNECREQAREGSFQDSKATPTAILNASVLPGVAAAVAGSGHPSKQIKASAIPEISYSSSEEDDDFFDAEEEDEVGDEAVTPTPRPGTLLGLTGVQMGEVLDDFDDPVKSPLTPVATAEGEINIDYDSLYDAADEADEDVDMKSHGSVITHLLSQVRIGMDLTKIVLPTFILERRSLLEMYSDFFAHPDVFVGIADGTTPEERMVRVLRWYLSSFHAGRKSAIAKKPYNPILGETFRCHWRLPGGDAGDSTTSASGPLPWCQASDLVFVAEQVSHHPPISAFYAEHPKRRISVNAHIYTKSSFLGMSVAVHNVGQGKLSLLDHGEEYTCTFPSGYGRSILTVPWIELGGKVTITCPQTGYLANIEFKCKQFFSSDVNKISAEIISPQTKKAILRVDGEWNGRMMAKWASGRNEVFVDVTRLPTHAKLVKRVAEQERMESRRLWKDVTYGLKVGDIESATAGKTALEQRQREEAASRKEKNIKWENALFQPIGENWEFNQPLEKRIAK